MSEPTPVPGPPDTPSPPPRLAFGGFELDPASGELRRAGRTIHLEPQPAKVLLFLLERAGQVVRRKDLQRHVWGEARHVEADQGLNYCVKELRNALGDSAREPRFIETLRRRGYRFLVPAVPIDRGPGPAPGAGPVLVALDPAARGPSRRPQPGPWAAAADDRLRVDVRLVDTEKDAVVWVGSFLAERASPDALARNLTEAVAGALRSGPAGARLVAR